MHFLPLFSQFEAMQGMQSKGRPAMMLWFLKSSKRTRKGQGALQQFCQALISPACSAVGTLCSAQNCSVQHNLFNEQFSCTLLHWNHLGCNLHS